MSSFPLLIILIQPNDKAHSNYLFVLSKSWRIPLLNLLVEWSLLLCFAVYVSPCHDKKKKSWKYLFFLSHLGLVLDDKVF